MILLISQNRPADQKYNALYFVLGEQWFNLTAHDMRTALSLQHWKIIDPRQPLEHLCPMSHPLHLLHLWGPPYILIFHPSRKV